MFADLPPQTFMRVLSSQYLDTYVDGEFCATTGELAPGVWRVDVGCSGSMVEFRNMAGVAVAALSWENWRLAIVGGD